jgi:hypothetical protein
MFGKNADTRWQETINYLNAKFPCAGLPQKLGDHIGSIVRAGPTRTNISNELSLGFRSDGTDDAGYAGKTEKRHALRGLLLCQRVYYSNLWAKQSEDGQGLHVIPFHALKPNWKKESLNFWGMRPEIDILSGIGMFAPVQGATRQDLQTAAYAGAPNGAILPGNLTLSRTDQYTVGAGVTCYVGVQGWLVKSGLVSMRWLMSNAAPNKQVGCDLLFGPGVERWNGQFRPDQGDRVPQIGAGYVVHIWSPQNYNWNGHWVITNGDGTICGVNNGEIHDVIPPVLKHYTNHSTLQDQFAGYGDQISKDPPRWRTAVMAEIDPLQMPNRL